MKEISNNAILIDVRSPGEFHGGYIEGSINVPLDVFGGKIQSICSDKNAEIVLCCASGMRSGSAQNYLKQLGYSNVINGGGVGTLSMRLNRRVIRG